MPQIKKITRTGQDKSLHTQIYARIKQDILRGDLRRGEKLPSIRRACQLYGASRTPVIAAYERLLYEGYLVSRERSGYRIAEDLAELGALPADETVQDSSALLPPTQYRYYFGTARIDDGLSDREPWRRSLRLALRDENALASYGDQAGEASLRTALSAYLGRLRGFRPDAGDLFIGAGVQTLLYALCGILPLQHIAFVGRSFRQAERVFRDMGMQTSVLKEEQVHGLIRTSDSSAEKAKQSGSDKASDAEVCTGLYLLPQARGLYGHPLTIAEIRALADWLSAHPRAYILEDDFNGELRYRAQPLPALSAFIRERTIYLGSFSKTLLPSLRIAYVALPPLLAERFREHLKDFNGSASVLEQRALADFISRGALERRLRKLRRIYAQKSEACEIAIRRMLPDAQALRLAETELSLYFDSSCNVSDAVLQERLDHSGICIAFRRQELSGMIRFRLCFAGIPAGQIDAGVRALVSCLGRD